MLVGNAALDWLLGDALRRFPSDDSIFLSFDDGPDPNQTPLVLDLLQKYKAKATFFVIAQKAQEQPQLIQRILEEGHSVGNHSLDHSYSIFFKGYSKIYEWVKNSEEVLREQKIKSVGFRPPVGIRTPELAKALRQMNIPMILWKQRCFDKAVPFDSRKAKVFAQQTESGDIVLLHDVQKEKWSETFLEGLEVFLTELKIKGLKSAPITF